MLTVLAPEDAAVVPAPSQAAQRGVRMAGLLVRAIFAALVTVALSVMADAGQFNASAVAVVVLFAVLTTIITCAVGGLIVAGASEPARWPS